MTNQYKRIEALEQDPTNIKLMLMEANINGYAQGLNDSSKTDAISREAVIEILGNYGCTNREGLIFKDIQALPPVTPKSESVTEFADRCRECGARYGKMLKSREAEWVDQYNDGNWHCTKCGAIVEKDEQINHNWYFCYHCGAKMKVRNED